MKNNENSTIIHASCVSIKGKAVLIMGDSGSGKSDLALRFIDEGATLVSDDYVQIALNGKDLLANPAPNISGLLEVRGIGLLSLPFISNIAIKLVVNLVNHEQIERMPEPKFFSCLEQEVPLLSLNSFDASATAKIRLALSKIE